MAAGGKQLHKTHIIVDDIISTGKTFAAAAECLRQKGVKNVVGVMTHNVARPEVLKRLAANQIPVFTANTIEGSGYDFDVLESVVAAAKEVVGQRG
jgi:phosphoribosylpyrophosphate synthetase